MYIYIYNTDTYTINTIEYISLIMDAHADALMTHQKPNISFRLFLRTGVDTRIVDASVLVDNHANHNRSNTH